MSNQQKSKIDKKKEVSNIIYNDYNRIVQLINHVNVKYGKYGMLALVVDGRKEFPDLYQQFIMKNRDSEKEFIWVKWITQKPYPPDGAYSIYRFKYAESTEKNV